MSLALVTLYLIVVVGLAFDFVNGFHDSANAIATVVSTRALSPKQAVLMAAVLDFTGACFSTKVAHTISSAIVERSLVSDQRVVLVALFGAITWNLLTWYWGLPSSSTHALIGGLVGAAWVAGGVHAIKWEGVSHKVMIPGIVSPLLGVVVGFFWMTALYWLMRNKTPAEVKQRFRVGQIFSAASVAFAHGANDAQKVMGIIALALMTANVQTTDAVPTWVKISCATCMALGTASGGWRIIKTMGSKISKLDSMQGFASDTTGAGILLTTQFFGMTVSTTHVISSAIMGVGSTKRLSAVRWTVAGNILGAWLVTLPAAATVSAIIFKLVLLIAP